MGREAKKCKQCGRKIYFDGICVQCSAENERNEILELQQTQMDEIVDRICAEIKETGRLDKMESQFTKLVNYRDIDTAQIAEAAFQKEVFQPYIIYKDAPAPIVKKMIDLLFNDSTDSRLAGDILLCLATRGGDDVLQAFFELEKNPRPWRKKLYVDPSFYATYGGWTYDENGVYREINFNKCYPMIKAGAQEKEHSPVKIGTKTDEACPHCGCRMVHLMELDGRDSRLGFLGIDGVIKAKCCPNCVGFSDGDFCRYTVDGESEMIAGEDFCTENYLEESDIDELAGNTCVLGGEPVPLRYAADWEGGSSVGGFAFWIQDSEIRHCPDCGKPMQYLAQIQWDTVLENMEGNAYIEICKDCRVMAILHQQT